jgi:hypothetical protein
MAERARSDSIAKPYKGFEIHNNDSQGDTL